jgi:alpha-tubulin suppressor-like RCC1 family protein
VAATTYTVWAWGNNGSGQLGDGTYLSSSVPVKSYEGYNANSLAAGSAHVVMMTEYGYVYGWGNNSHGQIGDGSNADYTSPVLVLNDLFGITSVAAGGNFSLARRSNGTTATWGGNLHGQLAQGTLGWRSTPGTVTLP